jgi:hypothetical protein
MLITDTGSLEESGGVPPETSLGVEPDWPRPDLRVSHQERMHRLDPVSCRFSASSGKCRPDSEMATAAYRHELHATSLPRKSIEPTTHCTCLAASVRHMLPGWSIVDFPWNRAGAIDHE